MKRPAYIQSLVDKANETFKRENLKDEKDNLFNFICDLLLAKNMYKGFNYYKKSTYEGKEVLRLAGSYDPNKFDCLQIW